MFLHSSKGYNTFQDSEINDFVKPKKRRLELNDSKQWNTPLLGPIIAGLLLVWFFGHIGTTILKEREQANILAQQNAMQSEQKVEGAKNTEPPKNQEGSKIQSVSKSNILPVTDTKNSQTNKKRSLSPKKPTSSRSISSKKIVTSQKLKSTKDIKTKEPVKEIFQYSKNPKETPLFKELEELSRKIQQCKDDKEKKTLLSAQYRHFQILPLNKNTFEKIKREYAGLPDDFLTREIGKESMIIQFTNPLTGKKNCLMGPDVLRVLLDDKNNWLYLPGYFYFQNNLDKGDSLSTIMKINDLRILITCDKLAMKQSNGTGREINMENPNSLFEYDKNGKICIKNDALNRIK